MVGKKTNSLIGKKFCSACDKDISTSYFSKHLKTIGHLRNADKNPAPKESSSESDASLSVSSADELKLDKIISSSESDQESEQEQEQPVDEEKDSSQSEQESEQSESEPSPEPTPEPSPEPVKKSKKVKNIKVKVEKAKSKPKPKKAGLYALSSSEEEPDQSVNPSGFLKFVNTLSNDFDITHPDEIKKVFNSVMSFGKPSYHLNPSVKSQLSRYLNKYERDNSHLDEDTVHQYLSNFLSQY